MPALLKKVYSPSPLQKRTSTLPYFDGRMGRKIQRINIFPNSSLPYRFGNRQTGMVLMVGLIMLLLISLIGTSAMQTTMLQEKMAGNQQERHKALQAAESAARYA